MTGEGAGPSDAPADRPLRPFPGWSRRAVLAAVLPALGAGAFWRLERGRPSWRFPGLWGASLRTLAAATLPRLVLAFHYPWYGSPAGPARRWRHWAHPRLALPRHAILGFHDPRRRRRDGRLDLGATHAPAGGPYDSAHPLVIRRQLAQAREAGLDGLIVSWWGRESHEARVFGAMLPHAEREGLRLAPYYEAGELWVRGGAGVVADLAALLGLVAKAPAWLRVDDRPVVFVYGAHRLRPPVWRHVLRRLQASGRHPFLVVDAPSPAWLDARPGWLTSFDALHVYSPAGILARGRDLRTTWAAFAAVAAAAGRPFFPAVGPGFDDRVVRSPGTVVDRAQGRLYEETWEAALAIDPRWVLVSSWNEWHEGSEIEPSEEHGDRYLRSTGRWAARLRERA